METKICSRCKQEKPLEEFSKCSTSADGLQYICKECMAQFITSKDAKRIRK